MSINISIPHRPQEQTGSGTTVVHQRLRNDTLAWLDTMAQAAGMDRAALIRSLLEAIVDDDRRDSAA